MRGQEARIKDERRTLNSESTIDIIVTAIRLVFLKLKNGSDIGEV